jgi:hypothetical protein
VTEVSDDGGCSASLLVAITSQAVSKATISATTGPGGISSHHTPGEVFGNLPKI